LSYGRIQKRGRVMHIAAMPPRFLV